MEGLWREEGNSNSGYRTYIKDMGHLSCEVVKVFDQSAEAWHREDPFSLMTWTFPLNIKNFHSLEVPLFMLSLPGARASN